MVDLHAGCLKKDEDVFNPNENVFGDTLYIFQGAVFRHKVTDNDVLFLLLLYLHPFCEHNSTYRYRELEL